jgi:hypothetical protein
MLRNKELNNCGSVGDKGGNVKDGKTDALVAGKDTRS